MTNEQGSPDTPFDQLGAMASQHCHIDDDLQHHEIYCTSGLLSLFWHGDAAARDVVIMCGGAMGGVLGPGDSLFQHLGRHLADSGRGAIRVGYRRPNDLAACVLDVAAAAELAMRGGAERFLLIGHSFGGGVVLSAGAALVDVVAGVVTVATQTSGAEPAEDFARPLLLFHGDSDQILPAAASEMVRMLCGGELVLIEGGDHLLRGGHDLMMDKLTAWMPATFDAFGDQT